MEAVSLRKRVQTLELQAARLQGMLSADTEQHDKITSEVALAKGRTALSEEISRIFDAMQQRAHQRSVGAFENLLSAVLNDVLPDEGKVRLLTQYKSNSTYLDIVLEKRGGLEDIVDGNGGAVTNVICAGLRFAALSRTQNRRLMVLDEPDCWLKPERVPYFVNVISQVSQDMGAQTFFITHHDTSYFEGKVNLVRFFADENDKVVAQALAPLANDWVSADQQGIRAIELINVRRHEHTIVPCFPGATAFIGDNNLGKSTAIGTAIKAMGYGESDDSMIRHGCTEATIIFHLEDNQKLEWTRNTKRSPSVLYRLFRDGELVCEGRPPGRNQAPDWVVNLLRIARVDDLDLQVGNQKSPVFLLNDPAPKRAQILSVGRESGHLKTFMKQYEELRSKDRETIKAGELVLARLKAKLRYLQPVPMQVAALESLAARGESLLLELEQRETLAKLESRVSVSQAAVKLLELELQALQQVPTVPEMTELSKLSALADRVSVGQGAVNALEQELLALRQVPALPEMADLSTLSALTDRIAAGQQASAIKSLPVIPEVPSLADIASVLALGVKLGQLTQLLNKLPQQLLSIPGQPTLQEQPELGWAIQNLTRIGQAVGLATAETAASRAEAEAAQNELHRIQEELGGECPLCGNYFDEHTHGAHHEPAVV